MCCSLKKKKNRITDKEPSLSGPVHVLKCFSMVQSGCDAHVLHVWCCLLSRSCCRNHKMKKQEDSIAINEAQWWLQANSQPLCNNWGASDMTCWRKPGHWVGFKCLLMSSSDSPQLCCWMLRKTWANSVASSSPSDYSFTLCAACGSLCNNI